MNDLAVGKINIAKMERMDDKDWLLQFYVAMVNTSKTGFSFDITLNVGGTLVTGTLTGGKQYLESMHNIFETNMISDDPKMVADLLFNKLIEEIYTDDEADESTDS